MKYPSGTYGGAWNLAQKELDEIKQSVPDDITLFAAIGSRAFSYATRLVMARRSDDVESFIGNQTRLETTMEALGKWHKKNDWPATWPLSPETFGSFQHAGQSALDVGLKFANVVKGAVDYARVASLKLMTQYLMNEVRANLAPWMSSTRDELENVTLDLSTWSMAAMRRDMEIIVLKINNELEIAIEKDRNPNSDDADIQRWADDIEEAERLRVAGEKTRNKHRRKVDQRRRNNPEKYNKALELVKKRHERSKNQMSNCQD